MRDDNHMTPAEARENEHYDSVKDEIPDTENVVGQVLEDLLIPAEAEALGLEDADDVAVLCKELVVEEIEHAKRNVPRDAQHFVENEVERAKMDAYSMAMAYMEANADEIEAVDVE